MNKAFIRVLPHYDQVAHPGVRLVLERYEDENLVFIKTEKVLPEKVNTPRCNHHQTAEEMIFSLEQIRWLHKMSGDLLSEVDPDDIAPE